MVIRTPDRRLRVFVSSIVGEHGELAAERRAVSRAISALRLTPVLFEEGARPHPPQDLYRAYLAQSDVFVGLYWQRYGHIGPGMQVSGLEEEFQLARAESLPRLLCVIYEGWVIVKRSAPGWWQVLVAADQVVVAWTSHLFGRDRPWCRAAGAAQSSRRPLHSKAMTHTERARTMTPATGLWQGRHGSRRRRAGRSSTG